MANDIALTLKDIQHRQLLALFVFTVVIAVETAVRRGKQPHVTPATALSVLEKTLGRCLGYDGYVDALTRVLSNSVEGIEELGARRARKILVEGAGKHHIVND